MALDRDDLLDTLARHILYPPDNPKEEPKGAEGGVERAEETYVEDREMKMIELRIRERIREEEKRTREEESELRRQKKRKTEKQKESGGDRKRSEMTS